MFIKNIFLLKEAWKAACAIIKTLQLGTRNTKRKRMKKNEKDRKRGKTIMVYSLVKEKEAKQTTNALAKDIPLHVLKLRILNPNLLLGLQSINLHANIQHPMIPLRPTPRLKYNRPPRYPQSGYISELLSRASRACIFIRSEDRLSPAVPDNEASHCVFVMRSPSILDIKFRKGMVAGVITIECLVLV